MAGSEDDITVWTVMRRPLACVLGLAVLLYVSFCVYLYLDQRNLLYFPEATHTDATDTNFLLARGQVQLKGWVFNGEQPDALLYFGGNAENLGAERNSIKAMFPARAIYLVPYRGYGPNDGEPTEKTLFSDAVALFDDVHAHHAKIAVVGRSLGSGVASYLASQRPVEKLVLVTPFDSLAGVAQSHYPMAPVGWLLKDRYDSLRYLKNFTGPILIIRAEDDEVVPQESTDRLIAGLPKKPSVIMIKNAGHNSVSDDPAYAGALSSFVH